MLSGAPPTALGIPDVNVYEDAADECIELYYAFDDADNYHSEMIYEVVGNTNSSLFDSVGIGADTQGGYGLLVLDFADDAYGQAELTVRATDPEYQWVETSFTVDVASVNDAPVVAGGIDDVNVYEDAVDESIELYYVFDDADHYHGDMTYEVVGNTNYSLFDSVGIGADTYGGYGHLVLDFADDAFGEAELTVRATDPGYQWVETSFTVDVVSVNDAPVVVYGIYDVYVYEDAADESIELYYDAFGDIDDSHPDMTYEVVGNTNSSLFDSVGIGADAYGGYGHLVLDFADDAHGQAELTVRATDPGYQWVETSFTVDVVSVNDAPSVASGIDDVYVYEDAADESIELYYAFDDADHYHCYMTYEVVGNTNSSLFDSVGIGADTQGGYGLLVLDFADDAYGQAELTVRATDPEYQWVETSFTVDVASVNDAPVVAYGIDDVNVYEDAADESIELYYVFDDADHYHCYITYEVVGNTNSSLFESVDIEADAYGGYGHLVLDFADDAFGEADITIRATDSDNQWVETSFSVDVAPVNDAPVISDFGASQGYGDYWTFSGTVTDVDDDVEGMTVTLGGVLANYSVTATVWADGTFSFADEFPGLQSGFATAQTNDDDGLYSNIAAYYIIVV